MECAMKKFKVFFQNHLQSKVGYEIIAAFSSTQRLSDGHVRGLGPLRGAERLQSTVPGVTKSQA